METLNFYADIESFKLKGSKKYNLKEIVKILNIDNTRIHLSRDLFKEVLGLYLKGNKNLNSNIEHNLKGFEKTVKKYKDIDSWENANSIDKILSSRKNYTNLVYYTIMVLCGRIKADKVTLNLNLKIPEIMNENEIEKITVASNVLNYNCIPIISGFRKLMLYFAIDLSNITENMLYEFSEWASSSARISQMFYVLKYIGNITPSAEFINKGQRNKLKFEESIKIRSKNLLNVYEDFIEFINKTEYKVTAHSKILETKRFMEWLEINYPEIKEINELRFYNIEDYAKYLKRFKTRKGNKLSTETVNTRLSKLKNGFFKYLSINKVLNDSLESDIFTNDGPYSDLYFDAILSNPKPISIKDRLNIEKAILMNYDDIDELYMDIIRSCYFTGARPSEILSLKFECNKGTIEVPSLHIHRAKKFKERYIPMISDMENIVKKWKGINRVSLPVYMKYDGKTVKRLFHRAGRVCTIQPVEDYFNEIMIRNNIKLADNKSKYSLYVLRRIRISTWLESGLTEDEVAYLVGHDCIDSHNNYIISKELRMKNANKVYKYFYKDLFETINSGEKYIYKKEEVLEDDDIQKLKQVLRDIESKTLNGVVNESIIKEFPEMIMPIPCGECMAKAYDDAFECEFMKLPCLECDSLLPEEIGLDFFDNYLKRLFKSREDKKKRNLDGLVLKINHQLEKIKQFYISKLSVKIEEVDEKFNYIEGQVCKKRGRLKK